MAQSLGQTGTSESITAEYFTWESAGGRFLVHMHREAIDGMARDILERSAGLPVEVGGLLLGHAGRGERPVVWIERYRRIECGHRSGPHFILDAEDHETLQRAASAVSGDLSVVGIYRSHLRPGFQLEPPDFELTDRYFKDPEDLFLLIGMQQPGELLAQFFLHEQGERAGAIQPADPPFPFSGRRTAIAAPIAPEDPAERTGKSAPVPPAPEPTPRRRLVPDFAPAEEAPPKPAREFFMESRPAPELFAATEDLHESRGFLRRRWPILAALLLVAGGVGVFLQQASHRDATAAPPVAADAAAVRPLGLYVDPASGIWRISWNPGATALQGARNVKLFVHDGDDQDLKELTANDLSSGTYQYQAKGPDVTFRLEVTGANGGVTAESFRVVKSAPPQAAEKPAAPLAPAPVARSKPVATHRVAPVVPASIRPRIKRTIPVDIRVRIDAQGRVASAVAVSKAHNGLETFLIGKALEAARQWRFEPAPPATEIIHFTFER